MTLRKRLSDLGEEPVDELAERRRNGHPVRSLLLFLLILAAGAVALLAVAVRLRGFREIAAVKSEQWFQARPSIEGSRIAFPYDLVLTGVSVPEGRGEAEAGLRIPEMRVKWRPGRGWIVTLERPAVRLDRTADGGFAPVELEKLGGIDGPAGIEDWLLALDRDVRLELRGGLFEVRGLDGKAERRMEGVRLVVHPVELPGRWRARHYRLEARPVTDAAGVRQQLVHEWLAVEGRGRLELEFHPESPGGAARLYWKGTHP